MNADLLPEEPSDLEPESVEPSDASDLDYEDMPCTDDSTDGDGDDGDDGDDPRWEAFIPDEDEWDPEPDPGDFWIENGRTDRETRRHGDKERELVFGCLRVFPSPCLLV